MSMKNFCMVFALNHICKKLWINQGRRVVNKNLRLCVCCKRSQGTTMKGPIYIFIYSLFIVDLQLMK